MPITTASVSVDPNDCDHPALPDHFLTVGLYPEPIPRIPWIRLKGKWLLDAGCAPDQRVRVRVSLGRLIITAEAP